MADIVQELEREYIIPLRESLRKVPSYKRTAKSIKTIKEFVAKHMKVLDRNVDRVKLDVYFNNEIWSQGTRRVLPKVKVKAKKDKEGNVFVTFMEVPKHIEFLKAKKLKRHVKTQKHEHKKEEKVEDKETLDKKTIEAEKEKAVAEAAQKEMKQQLKTQKHTQSKKEPEIHRMNLQK